MHMKNWNSEAEARQDIINSIADYYHAYKKTDNSFHEGDKISYGGRIFDEKEMCALVDSSLDFWLTAGKYTQEFESRFARMMGVRFASTVNSGSSANLIAFYALTAPELKERAIYPGDEVITVAAAFPTTISPIIQYGAVPVFLDVTIPQYNIDVTRLEEACSEKTKAVFIAHTLGNPFDLKAIKQFCDKHSLWLIEDTCDALGGTYTLDGTEYMVGSVGDIGTASFYPAHHITMGEGGCVFTDNAMLHKLIRSYRDWGRDCICSGGQDNFCGHRFDGQYGNLPKGYDHKYVYSHFGFNLKITDMQAAIGCRQLDKLPMFIEARRHNWKYLKDGLQNLKDRLILPEPEPNSDPSWFGFLITVGEGLDAVKMIRFLEDKGIQTRRLFGGNLLKHPCFTNIFRDDEWYRVIGGLQNTDRIMRDTFWLGVYPGMTNEKLDYIIRMINEAVAEQ